MFPTQNEFAVRSQTVADSDPCSIWRVLAGPNNDWPLGLCDYASIDPEKDTIPNDMLSRTAVGENELLFASPRHEWYYLSSQSVEEAILFRNASTDPKRSCKCLKVIMYLPPPCQRLGRGMLSRSRRFPLRA